MLSLYLGNRSESLEHRREVRGDLGSPIVVDRLDVEAESGADRVDVFAHDLLDDGRLSRIVEATASLLAQ